MSKNQIPWTSSKKDIYDAYKDVLQKYEKAIKDPPAPQKIARDKEVKEELVQKATTHSPEDLVEGISRMKLSIGRTLDDLGLKLANEAKKLSETVKAREFVEADLKRAEDAAVTADAIEQWIADHEADKQNLTEEFELRRKELETEISTAKARWKEEKEELERIAERERAHFEAEKKRQLDDYEYALNKRKKHDDDEAAEKRASLERELSVLRQKTEDELSSMRSELLSKKERYEQLEAEAKNLTTTIENVRAEERKLVEKELKSTYEHRIALLEHKSTSEREIYENKIKSMETYIIKQDERIAELNEKLEQQNTRVHEIANKAVEGASGAAAFSAVNKIAMEQAKRPMERDGAQR